MTVPRMRWPCVSACFLVWVAGTEGLSFSGNSKREGDFGVGLHRPYFSADSYGDSPSKVAERQQNVTAVIREYLKREQVPELFIEKMIERSSREVFWLRESGDPYALNGKAAWFQEMMIAKCGYDPVYDREGERLSVKTKGNSASAAGWLEWRQRFNACSYQIRLESQLALRSNTLRGR